jgi:V/A-type H+-transporting ATPase subunit I
MKKVCLMVQDKSRQDAMTKLREIGVLHLEKSGGSSDKLSKAIERRNRGESAFSMIEGYKPPKKKSVQQQPTGGRDRRAQLALGERRGRRATDKMGLEELEPYSLAAINAPDRPGLIDYMLSVDKDRKPLQEREFFLGREKARIQAWGEFTPATITEMNASGFPVFLYELTPAGFKEIPKETRYIKIGADKISVRLMVFDREIPGVMPFHLPEKPLSAIEQEEKEVKFHLNEIETRMRNLADRRTALVKEMAVIERDVEFEAAKAELKKPEGEPDEFSYSFLTGYIPAEDMGKLKTAATANNWALAANDPDPEDLNVPTKLKNSKFAQLIYPLTDFIEVTPAYREMDVSIWFLVFFSIFFAMIFGDGGYGLLMTITALALIIKTARNGVPLALKFFLLMAVCNLTWGVLTCAWFGIKIDALPQFLKDISLPYISSANSDKAFVTRNLQIFCFSVGLLHLTIAHLKRIFANIKTLRVLGDVGTLGILWGMYNVVLLLVVGMKPPMPTNVFISLIGGGWVLTFVFNSYEGSIGKSILTSCQNFIGMVLNITGAFADIMSYIRLWAVGLAGAAIADTINTMAGPMLGGFLIFAGIILLVAGHGINFALAVIGVLVHGVRLNTLEFSSHAGLSWSGTKYRPFAVK